MAIATTLDAGVSVDAGDDGDRLYGPRADAVSRLAPDGGIFRVGADICLVDRGLLVSRAGSDGHTQKRATGTGVCHEFRALAVFALTAIHVLGGRIVYRVDRTRFVAPGYPG